MLITALKNWQTQKLGKGERRIGKQTEIEIEKRERERKRDKRERESERERYPKLKHTVLGLCLL